MKFLLQSWLGIALLGIMLSLSSCIPDHCKDTVCQNGGVCVLGSCSCLNGFEGQNCNEVWNERFLGTWFREIPLHDTLVWPPADSLYVAKTWKEEISLISNGRADQFLIKSIGYLDSILCRRLSYAEFAFMENQFIDSSITILSGSGFIDSAHQAITGSYIVENGSRTTTFQLNLRR
jgi:hypothetical protein